MNLMSKQCITKLYIYVILLCGCRVWKISSASDLSNDSGKIFSEHKPLVSKRVHGKVFQNELDIYGFNQNKPFLIADRSCTTKYFWKTLTSFGILSNRCPIEKLHIDKKRYLMCSLLWRTLIKIWFTKIRQTHLDWLEEVAWWIWAEILFICKLYS